MLPNVRLMIAAMLASVVALICGFGIFAAFRVSHEPFAHLPAAAAPLQIVADNAAETSAPGLVSEETVARRFASNIPANAEEPAGPAAAAERHAEAEALAEPEQKAAPQTIAAMDAEQSAAADLEEKPSTMAEPAGQTTASAVPASELPAVSEDSDHAAAMTAVAPTPRPATEPATEPPTPIRESNTTDEAPSSATGATDPVTKSAMVSAPAGDAAPAAERAVQQTPPEPPLPRERPNPAVQPARSESATAERRHENTAGHPKHARVVVRIWRAPRVAAVQYVEVRYAQTSEQSYGYGQTNFQAAPALQNQLVIRRVVGVRRVRVAAKRLNPATGGPFVSVPAR